MWTLNMYRLRHKLGNIEKQIILEPLWVYWVSVAQTVTKRSPTHFWPLATQCGPPQHAARAPNAAQNFLPWHTRRLWEKISQKTKTYIHFPSARKLWSTTQCGSHQYCPSCSTSWKYDILLFEAFLRFLKLTLHRIRQSNDWFRFTIHIGTK